MTSTRALFVFLFFFISLSFMRLLQKKLLLVFRLPSLG